MNSLIPRQIDEEFLLGGLFADKQTELRIIRHLAQNFRHTFVYFTNLHFPKNGDIIYLFKGIAQFQKLLTNLYLYAIIR